MPLLAVASDRVLLSTVTHNSAAAVVGALMISLLMQLITIIPGLGGLQPYLLPTQFNAWQGLLRTPADYAPMIRAAWVCALYAIPCWASPTSPSCAATSPAADGRRGPNAQRTLRPH